MNISNYELAVLIGELTGSKTTSMSYGAALAVFRDDSEPCTVDDVAELLRGAMQHPSRRKGKKSLPSLNGHYVLQYTNSIITMSLFLHFLMWEVES